MMFGLVNNRVLIVNAEFKLIKQNKKTEIKMCECKRCMAGRIINKLKQHSDKEVVEKIKAIECLLYE